MQDELSLCQFTALYHIPLITNICKHLKLMHLDSKLTTALYESFAYLLTYILRQWGVNNLPKVVAQQRHSRGSNPRPLDRKSDALPLSHRTTPALVRTWRVG